MGFCRHLNPVHPSVSSLCILLTQTHTHICQTQMCTVHSPVITNINFMPQVANRKTAHIYAHPARQFEVGVLIEKLKSIDHGRASCESAEECQEAGNIHIVPLLGALERESVYKCMRV